jgi:hypothetical protein
VRWDAVDALLAAMALTPWPVLLGAWCVFGSFAASAAQVAWPTTASTFRPCAAWNCFSATMV